MPTNRSTKLSADLISPGRLGMLDPSEATVVGADVERRTNSLAADGPDARQVRVSEP